MSGRMHTDEIEVAPDLVRGLLESQFPERASLPLRRVRSDGTDNAIYRLGEDLAVRLPRYPGAVAQIEKEARWLPELAPSLPLPVPEPVALGAPADGYPWPWTVVRWLPGATADPDELVGSRQTGRDLARFVAALREIDAGDAPLPGDHNFGRGVPLAERDGYVRDALAQLEGVIDTGAAHAAWESALAAPPHAGPPVWIHGDLHAGNLLARDGRLSGVLDFGGLGAGDPACDVMAAWTFLAGEARDAFRTELDVDDAAWERGRGWALSVGLIALPYYRETNLAFAANARRWIDAAMAGLR